MIKDIISSKDFETLTHLKIAAITGPMAAGKNYVSSLLEKEGFVSIDADIVVHDAIKLATNDILAAFSSVAKDMGINLLNEDKSLNRRELGKIVFSDRALLKKQEDIVYPYVNTIINQFIEDNKDKKILINATVLYKTPQLLNRCQAIIYVTAPFFTRLKRANKRDNMDVSLILKRFHNQRDLYKKYKETGINIIKIVNK